MKLIHHHSKYSKIQENREMQLKHTSGVHFFQADQLPTTGFPLSSIVHSPPQQPSIQGATSVTIRVDLGSKLLPWQVTTMKKVLGAPWTMIPNPTSQRNYDKRTLIS